MIENKAGLHLFRMSHSDVNKMKTHESNNNVRHKPNNPFNQLPS
jgi:hypothetical protein